MADAYKLYLEMIAKEERLKQAQQASDDEAQKSADEIAARGKDEPDNPLATNTSPAGDPVNFGQLWSLLQTKKSEKENTAETMRQRTQNAHTNAINNQKDIEKNEAVLSQVQEELAQNQVILDDPASTEDQLKNAVNLRKALLGQRIGAEQALKNASEQKEKMVSDTITAYDDAIRASDDNVVWVDDMVRIANDEITRVQNEAEVAQKEENEAKAEVDRIQADVNTTDNEVSKIQSEIRQIEEKLKTVTAGTQEETDLISELDSKKALLAPAQADLQTKQKELATANNNFAEKSAVVQEKMKTMNNLTHLLAQTQQDAENARGTLNNLTENDKIFRQEFNLPERQPEIDSQTDMDGLNYDPHITQQEETVTAGSSAGENNLVYDRPFEDEAETTLETGDLNDEVAQHIVSPSHEKAVASKEQTEDNEDNGIYATEAYFRAKYVKNPFWLSDRRKDAWNKCSSQFLNAHDLDTMLDGLMWGTLDLVPQMALAYFMWDGDEERKRLKSAQDDMENWDRQLILQKGITPAQLQRIKLDYIYGSPELTDYIQKKNPALFEGLPQKDGKIDIENLTERQRNKLSGHVHSFILDTPHYKSKIERFLHREFGKDELEREANGLSNPEHLSHLNDYLVPKEERGLPAPKDDMNISKNALLKEAEKPQTTAQPDTNIIQNAPHTADGQIDRTAIVTSHELMKTLAAAIAQEFQKIIPSDGRDFVRETKNGHTPDDMALQLTNMGLQFNDYLNKNHPEVTQELADKNYPTSKDIIAQCPELAQKIEQAHNAFLKENPEARNFYNQVRETSKNSEKEQILQNVLDISRGEGLSAQQQPTPTHTPVIEHPAPELPTPQKQLFVEQKPLGKPKREVLVPQIAGSLKDVIAISFADKKEQVRSILNEGSTITAAIALNAQNLEQIDAFERGLGITVQDQHIQKMWQGQMNRDINS